MGGSTYKPLTFRDKNLTLLIALSWTKGRHDAKFGYEYRHLNSHPNFLAVSRRPMSTSAAHTMRIPAIRPTVITPIAPCNNAFGFYDPSAYYGTGGSEIADLLLGLPYVVDQGLQLTNASTTANEHTFYVQDYWQINPQAEYDLWPSLRISAALCRSQ